MSKPSPAEIDAQWAAIQAFNAEQPPKSWRDYPDEYSGQASIEYGEVWGE